MTKDKLKKQIEDAMDEGRNDTHVDNELIQSAQLYVEEIKGLTDKQQDEVLNAYMEGFCLSGLPTKKGKNQKLVIDVTESDCHDLIRGEKFDWTFTTDKDEDIDIRLYNPDM